MARIRRKSDEKKKPAEKTVEIPPEGTPEETSDALVEQFDTDSDNALSDEELERMLDEGVGLEPSDTNKLEREFDASDAAGMLAATEPPRMRVVSPTGSMFDIMHFPDDNVIGVQPLTVNVTYEDVMRFDNWDSAEKSVPEGWEVMNPPEFEGGVQASVSANLAKRIALSLTSAEDWNGPGTGIYEIDNTLGLTVDEALETALSNVIDNELDPDIYDGLLSKLGETEQASFTAGLVNEGVLVQPTEVEVGFDMGLDFVGMHAWASQIHNSGETLTESDIEEIVESADTERAAEKFLSWAQNMVPKQRKFKRKVTDQKGITEEYEKEVTDLIKNPNINNFKAEKEEKKKVEINKVLEENVDSDWDTEFYPPWDIAAQAEAILPEDIDAEGDPSEQESEIEEFVKHEIYLTPNVEELLEEIAVEFDQPELASAPWVREIVEDAWEDYVVNDESSYSFENYEDSVGDLEEEMFDETATGAPYNEYGQQGVDDFSRYSSKIDKRVAQRIDEEKRVLEDTLRSRQNEIPNWKDLLKKVQRALDFSELTAIWEAIKGMPAYATTTATFGSSSFALRVATTAREKADGLEVVASMEETAGMLFPFEDESVTFHMGSVKFPIDVLFLTDSPLGLRVGKIVHNAMPGSEDRWSFENVACVIELVGGACKASGVKVGGVCELDAEEVDENITISAATYTPEKKGQTIVCEACGKEIYPGMSIHVVEPENVITCRLACAKEFL